MATTVNREDALERSLCERVEVGVAHLISIDGASGSGKTTTGDHLASSLGCNHFDLDKNVSGEQPSYLDRVDYGALSEAISGARADATPLIVSGICVLSALDRIGEHADTRVYIRRLSAGGMPADIDLFDEACPWFTKLSADPAEEGRKPYTYGQDWIDRQVGSYHKGVQPIQNADLIFDRTE